MQADTRGLRILEASRHVIIRNATEVDITAMTEIRLGHAGGQRSDVEAIFYRDLTEIAEGREKIILVAVSGQEVVGYARAAHVIPDCTARIVTRRGKPTLKEHDGETCVNAAFSMTQQMTMAASGSMAPIDDSEIWAPDGYYLLGVLIPPSFRRRGFATALTEARLDWISRRKDRAWYFANAHNDTSIQFHHRFGFHEVTRRFCFHGVTFVGGQGILFSVSLPPSRIPLHSEPGNLSSNSEG